MNKNMGKYKEFTVLIIAKKLFSWKMKWLDNAEDRGYTVISLKV